MGVLSGVMITGKITDMDIQALIDGQMDEPSAARISDAIARDPTLAQRYAQYAKQKKLLQIWWKDN